MQPRDPTRFRKGQGPRRGSPRRREFQTDVSYQARLQVEDHARTTSTRPEGANVRCRSQIPVRDPPEHQSVCSRDRCVWVPSPPFRSRVNALQGTFAHPSQEPKAAVTALAGRQQGAGDGAIPVRTGPCSHDTPPPEGCCTADRSAARQRPVRVARSPSMRSPANASTVARLQTEASMPTAASLSRRTRSTAFAARSETAASARRSGRPHVGTILVYR